ncbi:DUF4442 domain-containing protein [Dokdonia ponticola]|uniref:DUF4442 domain-containing protein n=1 Tax=Dokdonia ponticola TaxID=2041041 RepID=A0ABV9HTP2_9FLAO
MKNVSPSKFNMFTMLKLPAAWLTGVRLKTINEASSTVQVTHRWINQNPFKSMFWAVQGMAAELSTGALVISYIRNSDHKISMLVASNNATFTKKATGRITFTCNDGTKIKETIAKAIATSEGQTCWMKSVGTNKEGIQVSEFNFEWTVKVRS